MKRALIFIFIGFIFASQATAQSTRIKYAVIPENPRPGEPITIGVNDGTVEQAILLSGERRLAKGTFFYVPADDGCFGFFAALLTVPSTASPGDMTIKLENENGVILEIPLIVTERKFVSEVIELNSTLTGIRTDPDPQKTTEANRLWAIITETGSEIYYNSRFIPPVSSTRMTSFFGDRRVFKYSNGNSDTSIHAGVDYGVPTGTRVYACGSGKVRLARNRIVTGNSVIIEHAPGVYSLYYHLDKIEVKEDDIISTATLIGLVGSTGLATGPHLHWELRVNTENTDPFIFIERSIIDKDLILSKIGN